MSEVKRIADQLERAFEGGAWHGPSVREVLDGVTAEQALSRPLSASAQKVGRVAGASVLPAPRASGY